MNAWKLLTYVRMCVCVCVEGMVDECEGCVHANMSVHKNIISTNAVPFPHIVILQ